MIGLRIEVPVAGWRHSYAREYGESYPVPPPATVYGMLLSMVGEINRYSHCGCQIAIALLSKPNRSTVLRTIRRVKVAKQEFDKRNARPDFQELLTGIDLGIWVDAGDDVGKPKLLERLQEAMVNPESVRRFGGLSLGESRDLINSVVLWRSNFEADICEWLVSDRNGYLALPCWTDRAGSKKTRWGRYVLADAGDLSLADALAFNDCWSSIGPQSIS
ncbi:MAG: type I-MYXAN CRISPR-associated protein Cas5/Cmx5/DevS [Oscillatoriaceae cyanobacterium Prado104]|jgi:CRISPR-associated protein Cas5t|nr:type I-MYXAN CRISPR-associated protein Cas5/Cmx5/DevS [Oscillatoriaceae cyanobacterium Prado104]